jgi:hypothetical protein
MYSEALSQHNGDGSGAASICKGALVTRYTRTWRFWLPNLMHLKKSISEIGKWQVLQAKAHFSNYHISHRLRVTTHRHILWLVKFTV